jgi:hypothetical protein
MNKQTMTEAVLPTVAELRDFTRQINNLASLLERTCQNDTDGTNLSSLTAIREALNHPWFATSKARPVLNGAYKALFENAKYNADSAQREARAHLAAFAPPKRGRKKKESVEVDVGAEPATIPDVGEDASIEIDASTIEGL